LAREHWREQDEPDDGPRPPHQEKPESVEAVGRAATRDDGDGTGSPGGAPARAEASPDRAPPESDAPFSSPDEQSRQETLENREEWDHPQPDSDDEGTVPIVPAMTPAFVESPGHEEIPAPESELPSPALDEAAGPARGGPPAAPVAEPVLVWSLVYYGDAREQAERMRGRSVCCPRCGRRGPVVSVGRAG